MIRTRPDRAAATAGAQSTLDPVRTLFSVRFRHDYYNATDDRCRDLVAVPTDDCAALMAQIGIIQVNQDAGFSIVVPQSRVGALVNAIVQGYCASGPGQGFWTRLRFLLVSTNENFVGITDWPIDTSPTRQALFTDNLAVHEQPDGLSLGDHGLGAAALLPVTGGTISLPAGPVGTVTALDLSGAPVASVQRSATVPVILSLAGLPNDRYTIIGTPPEAYTGPAQLAYVPPASLATGMIDLLLTQPTADTGDPAAFPVPMPPAPPPPDYAQHPVPITPVALIAQFRARKTFWRYFVVPHAARGAFTDTLAITGQGTAFGKSKAVLPNGDAAILFSAETPLAMRQRSPHRFRLSGERHSPDGGQADISVDPLPCAATSPVWPVTEQPLTGTSEIYVYI